MKTKRFLAALSVGSITVGTLFLLGCSASDPATDGSRNSVSPGGSGGPDGPGGPGGPGSAGNGSNGPDNGIIGDDEPGGVGPDIPLEDYNCGDGLLGEGENCDDGNAVGGDGCSADCTLIEDGYVCPTLGIPCEFTTFCGDGILTPPETCDDKNTTNGDGCTESCAPELGWSCPNPGQPCVYSVVCGDAFIVNGIEECDDGNTESGDGCTSDCVFEPGYECGDGLVAGNEECDDGGQVAGDGCSPSCVYESGFVCDASGCRETVCGDGVKEGGEPCDDGENSDMGDGCSPGCFLEPTCSPTDGTCTSSCGDGLILAGDNEECDDGNSKDGDGCSSTCTIEAGWDCPIVSDADAGTLQLPIVYRDFYGVGSSAAMTPPNANGHADFENEQFSRNTPKLTVTSSEGMVFEDIAGPTQGLVNTQLGAGQNGPLGLKPTYLSPGAPAQISSAMTFHQWYVDTPGVNTTVIEMLTLAGGAQAGTFAYDTNAFYPLDGLGLAGAGAPAPGPEPARPTDWLGEGCGERQPDGQWTEVTGSSHNYSFTSEVRYWFEYQGGEQLVFRGDDDVWVYIKGQLVVDLGGNHEPYGGDVCGNIWSNVEDQPTCAGLGPNTTDVSGAPLGLQQGRVYEVVVFQAERHTCQSNYKLTLSNFARDRSECAGICGDGIVVGDEACDDGEMNGMGYGFCAADCTRGPRCGDGIVDAAEGEDCDNGVNLDRYFTTETACGPECKFPAFCGDGVVDTAFAERCDLGAEENIGAYGGCDANCQLGPLCGDGIVNEGFEECDDMNRANNDGCSSVCTEEPTVRERSR